MGKLGIITDLKHFTAARTRIRTQEAFAGYLFALPSLAGFLLFFILPLLISFYYCFTKGVGVLEFVGFKNFIDLFKSNSFMLAFRNTLRFNAVCVPLIMVVSLGFAHMLNSNIKGLPYYRLFFIIPLVIPVASVILVWQIIFDEYGAINKIIADAGILPVDWLKTGWSFWILILLYIWKNCGYNVILFIAGLNNIPVDYYQSAMIDGAGRFRCFRSITLPLLAPTAFFVFIMSIINSFKVFREAYCLAGSYPQDSIYMVQHFMNNNFFNLSFQRLSVAAFITVFIIIILVFTLFRVESKLSE